MWFTPTLPMTQESEAAIVKAPAHAQALAARIEAHEWHQHEIEVLRAYQQARRETGFVNPIAIGDEVSACVRGGEPQAVVTQAREHRQIAALAQAPEGVDDGGGVDLAVVRQITGDAPAGAKRARG